MTSFWYAWFLPMLWQGSLVAIGVSLIDLAIGRRLHPAVRESLWCLVFAKHLLAPGVSSPLPFVGAALPAAAQSSGGSAASSGWLPMLWVAGFALSALWVARRHRAASRAHRRVAEMPSPGLALLFASLVSESIPSWQRRPSLRVISGLKSPFVIGVLDPKIFIPQEMADELKEDELRLVLLHELTHVRRWDLLRQAVILAIQLVYWFQPLLWWAGRQATLCRELSCDATVNRRRPTVRRSYERLLLRMALEVGDAPSLPRLPLGAAFGRAMVLDRVRELELSRPHRPWRQRISLTTLFLAAVVLLPMGIAMERRDAAQAVERALEEGSSLQVRYSVMRLAAIEEETTEEFQ